MISVQNHLPQLNGNKFIFIFISVFILSSCGIFSGSSSKKPPTRRKKKPKTYKEKEQSKVDSLEWPDQSKKEDDNEVDFHGTVKKDHYTIDMLIPLDSRRSFENIEGLEKSISNKFLHYYSGVLLALEDLENQGFNVTLNVMDAPIKNDRIIELKRKINSNIPDVIIGPYSKDQLQIIANFSKRKGITLVSPWKAIPKLTSDNPNYIQLKPALDNYYKTIVENVDENYSPENVYMLGLDKYKHKKRIKLLQKMHKTNVAIKEYNVFFIDQDSLKNGETVFDDIFKEGDMTPKVFIIPNWSYKDEAFIYSVLRRLNNEKGERKVTVYGMPILTKSSKIGYSLFKRLNIRVASPSYYEDNDWEIKKFRNRYYKKFKTFPIEDSYEGYDMMMYTGTNLINYGTKFQFFIEENEQNYLNSSFNLKRNVKEQNILDEKLDKINYFENTKLYILGFDQDKFKEIK